ncbi:MAG TPA: class II aldolase/adducin family protein [Streptosporangiaceae bacterium]|jgi:L-fuculose-phosphate aldolase
MSDGVEAARAEVAACGRRLAETGLVVGSAGNVSVRVGDRVAITPSGVPYHRVAADDVCVLDLDGGHVAGPATPSSETPLHLSLYAATDAAAVVHHHGVSSAAVSTVLDELPAIHYATTLLGGPLRVADYATFGTPELAAAVMAALRDRTAALMRNHGAVAYAATLDAAFDRAHLVEWLCQVWAQAVRLGTPRVLTDDELADVVRRRNRGRTETRT